MLNGVGPAKPLNGVPRSSPNHTLFPFASLGPSHILFTAAASFGVRQFGLDDGPPFAAQTNSFALYVHARGSCMNPSTMPSRASHAAMDASVTALSLSGEIGAPTSWFITTAGQSSAVMKRSQLNALAPARMPSKSLGKFCACMCPCRPPVEQPIQYVYAGDVP